MIIRIHYRPDRHPTYDSIQNWLKLAQLFLEQI
jgi:hypothetical protein